MSGPSTLQLALLCAATFAVGVWVGSRWGGSGGEGVRTEEEEEEWEEEEEEEEVGDEKGGREGVLARSRLRFGRRARGGVGGERHRVEELAKIFSEFKMVLVVRNDLKMGKGKIGAQCGHATLGLFKRIHRSAPTALSRWENCGQVKVVVKVDSEEEMMAIQASASAALIPTHITIDQGRTQIAPNSKTVMALFGPDDLLKEVTGHLKLL